jgi:enediyne biosynthesis protein E4
MSPKRPLLLPLSRRSHAPAFPAVTRGVGWALLMVWVGCGDASPVSSPRHASSFSSESVGTIPATQGNPGQDSAVTAAVAGDPLPAGSLSAEAFQPGFAATGRFTRLDPAAQGMDFRHVWAPPEQFADRLNSYAVGVGVAIGDIDGDGLPDVFLACQSQGGRLYRNRGDFRFEEITEQAGLELGGYWTTGVAMADIDNDGHLDLYLCSFGQPNRLYVNQGNGTFREQAETYGLAYQGASVAASFADYDNDGLLDMYLVTNHYPLLQNVNIPLRRDSSGRPQVVREWEQYRMIMNPPRGVAQPRIVEAAQYDRLYRNTGQGRFEDVTVAAGIGEHNYHGLSATWLDYDGDGNLDLYVANDFYGPDHFYRNQGDGTFVDVIGEVLPYFPWFSMGADAADVNNDGWIDLLATDMSATSLARSKMTMGEIGMDGWFLDHADPPQLMRNMLQINTGAGRFLEAAHFAGVASTDWTWSVKFADLDGDTRVDLYVTNGMTRDFQNSDLKQASLDAQARGLLARPHDFWEQQLPLAEQNLVYRNLGDLQFADESRSWGLDMRGVSLGAAFGDLDGDGDLDLVVNNFDDIPALYRNDLADGGRHVQVCLRGRRSNSYGIGGEVRLFAQGGEQVRQLVPGRGYMSSDEPIVHFGLGEATQIDRLELRWPSGGQQIFHDLTGGNRYTIVEPDALPHSESRADSGDETALFMPSRAADALVHRENLFEDFQDQPLLPRALSRLGPALAAGDTDGDGVDELFLGGAVGRPGSLYRLHNGSFEPVESWDSTGDAVAEDQGALFFDANGDGDLDLYVVSGGVEHGLDGTWYQDRLYLNDGEGNFSKQAEALPPWSSSGSCVAAADYDRDGDLDLYVGGRLVPGAYPTSPESCLLANESEGRQVKFRDVTASVAPELRTSGMVTAAVWADVNGDGWSDLVVAHEWGPVRLFMNEQGTLREQTAGWGLADRLGWWTGLAAADFDQDGRIDLVVTNFGLNTPYRASAAHPTMLFFHDFAGSGVRRLLEAGYDRDGRLVPLVGLTSLREAIPELVAQFSSHQQYAAADLEAVVSQKLLAEVPRWSVNELRSGVLLNRGEDGFEFHALPMPVQLAPAFAPTILDVNQDGVPDLFVGQNFSGSRREVGRLGGGLGVVLVGDGRGAFRPLGPNESGIAIPQEARAVVATDFNRDGRVDLVIGVNNGQARAFTTRKAP